VALSKVTEAIISLFSFTGGYVPDDPL